MADTTTTTATTAEKTQGRRKLLIGEVVSTKMAKTIVVEVHRQKAHPFYKRVVKRSKRFYAHDENGTAKLGDVVKIEETRPLSKLKRWQLKEIVRQGRAGGACRSEAGLIYPFAKSGRKNGAPKGARRQSYGSDDEKHARCRR